jgi:hypothetical protein
LQLGPRTLQLGRRRSDLAQPFRGIEDALGFFGGL